MKHPASPAAIVIASVRDLVPELEFLAVERAVMERALMGKEIRVLLPAASSLRVVVLAAVLSACLTVGPRIAFAVKDKNKWSEERQQMEGREHSMVQMFAPQGSASPERHVNSAAGRCVIRHTSRRER